MEGLYYVDRQEVEYEGTDWTELAQVRNRWRAIVNAVMIIRVQHSERNFLIN